MVVGMWKNKVLVWFCPLLVGGGDGGEGLPPPCPGGVLVPIYNALPWG